MFSYPNKVLAAGSDSSKTPYCISVWFTQRLFWLYWGCWCQNIMPAVLTSVSSFTEMPRLVSLNISFGVWRALVPIYGKPRCVINALHWWVSPGSRCDDAAADVWMHRSVLSWCGPAAEGGASVLSTLQWRWSSAPALITASLVLPLTALKTKTRSSRHPGV